MKKLLLYSFFGAPLLALIFISIHVYILFNSPYSGNNTFFTINPGEGFATINYRLNQEKLISNPRLFHYYTKYKDLLGKFKAGTYEIQTGMKMADVLDTLVNGTPILNTVTIPEGKNMYEIAAIMEVKGICSKAEFLKLVKSPKLIQDIAPNAVSLEGYLFPETYKFAPGTTASEVVKAMVDLFRKKTADMTSPYPNLSFHQLITLASVVEKETGAKFERPLIAGVFHNRLNKKMRLQSDPTTIYGIWENFKGNIRKEHLSLVNPYNTYKIPGLPVGPICSPSFEAIEAVLKPEVHNYLFFVSKNDGTHVFTESYKDHNAAVDDYQRNSKNRQGKSWRDLKQAQ